MIQGHSLQGADPEYQKEGVYDYKLGALEEEDKHMASKLKMHVML